MAKAEGSSKNSNVTPTGTESKFTKYVTSPLRRLFGGRKKDDLDALRRHILEEEKIEEEFEISEDQGFEEEKRFFELTFRMRERLEKQDFGSASVDVVGFLNEIRSLVDVLEKECEGVLTRVRYSKYLIQKAEKYIEEYEKGIEYYKASLTDFAGFIKNDDASALFFSTFNKISEDVPTLKKIYRFDGFGLVTMQEVSVFNVRKVIDKMKEVLQGLSNVSDAVTVRKYDFELEEYIREILKYEEKLLEIAEQMKSFRGEVQGLFSRINDGFDVMKRIGSGDFSDVSGVEEEIKRRAA